MDFGYAAWGSVSSEGVTPVTHTFDAPRDLLAQAAS